MLRQRVTGFFCNTGCADNSAVPLPCRLDALLSALSKGKGGQLTNPWPIIHPDNAVTSLSQALDPKHDAYYRKLPKFKFLNCLDHYESGK